MPPPTRRLVIPWVNSWKTTVESKAVWRLVDVTMPMFMTGLCPSTDRLMLAVPCTAPGQERASTAIAADATAPEIVCLEVERRLAEPEQIREIVHVAAVVEDVEDLLVVPGGTCWIECEHAVLDRPGQRRSGGAQMRVRRVALGLVRRDPGVRKRVREAVAGGDQAVVTAAHGLMPSALQDSGSPGCRRRTGPGTCDTTASRADRARTAPAAGGCSSRCRSLSCAAACRAVGAGVAGEEQALALVAPAPVGLSRIARRVLHQEVVPAAGLVVRATGRAVGAGVAGEEQALALVAPAPVGLCDSRDRQNVVVDRPRKVRHLSSCPGVDAIDVADRCDVLDQLVAVENVAGGRIHDRLVLRGKVGHRQEHVPTQGEPVCEREPHQAAP